MFTHHTMFVLYKIPPKRKHTFGATGLYEIVQMALSCAWSVNIGLPSKSAVDAAARISKPRTVPSSALTCNHIKNHAKYIYSSEYDLDWWLISLVRKQLLCITFTYSRTAMALHNKRSNQPLKKKHNQDTSSIFLP